MEIIPTKNNSVLFSRKEEVLGKIAAIYEVTPKEAESLVAYHAELRSKLNEFLVASATGKHFQVRPNFFTRASQVISSIVSAVFPPAGSLAAVASGAIAMTQEYFQESDLAKGRKILEAIGGIENLNQFTKSLSTELTKIFASHIKHLSPTKSEERAKSDFGVVMKNLEELAKIAEESPSKAAGLLDDASEENSKTQISKTLGTIIIDKVANSHGVNLAEIEAKQQVESLMKNTQEHPDLGNFTHQVLNHKHENNHLI
jgi:hypothetical protein